MQVTVTKSNAQKISKQEEKYRLTSKAFTFTTVLPFEEHVLSQARAVFPFVWIFFYFTFFLEHSSASLMYYSNRSND